MDVENAAEKESGRYRGSNKIGVGSTKYCEHYSPLNGYCKCRCFDCDCDCDWIVEYYYELQKDEKKEIEIAASNRMPFAMLTIVTVMRATSVMQMMLQVIDVDIVVAARIVVI